MNTSQKMRNVGKNNFMRKLALSDEILLKISQPARYIGGEVNMVKKDPSHISQTDRTARGNQDKSQPRGKTFSSHFYLPSPFLFLYAHTDKSQTGAKKRRLRKSRYQPEFRKRHQMVFYYILF